MTHSKNRFMAAVLFIMVMVFASGSVFGAKIPTFLVKGRIESGRVESGYKDYLRTSHIWEYSGEKGTRAVIAAVFEKCANPPEMFLFKPGTSECVATGELRADGQALVIDKALEVSGTYLLLIRPQHGEKSMEYRLALEEIPTEATYTIITENSSKKVIEPDLTIVQKDDRSIVMKGAMLLITPFVVLPMTVASLGFHIYSGIGMAMDVINVPGYVLFENIVKYGQGG